MTQHFDEHLPALTEEGVAHGRVEEWAHFCSDAMIDKSRSGWRREQIIDLGKMSGQLPVQELLTLLTYETNENNRESALKALANHGGERVLTVLEAT